jgi:hypothetical protein
MPNETRVPTRCEVILSLLEQTNKEIARLMPEPKDRPYGLQMLIQEASSASCEPIKTWSDNVTKWNEGRGK